MSLGEAEIILLDATEKTGWNDYSQLLVVLAFIEEKNLLDDFQEYLNRRISEEEAECAGENDENQETS